LNGFLRQSTAIDVLIGPFYNNADFKTPIDGPVAASIRASDDSANTFMLNGDYTPYFRAGQIFSVTGSPDNMNDGYYKVLSASVYQTVYTLITVDSAYSSIQQTDDPPGPNGTITVTAPIDVELSKNGQALTDKSDSTVPVHDSKGFYNCELDANDTNTIGILSIVCSSAWSISCRYDYQVLSHETYDSILGNKLNIHLASIG
jgi:hypothetical protein